MSAELKQSVSLKPTVALISRDLSNKELSNFYKHFSNVLYINELTFDKKVIELTEKDCVLCDIRRKTGRDWYSINNKYLQENTDNTVWLRATGDEVEDEEFLKSVRYENKRFHHETYADKASFIHELFSKNTTPKVITKKMKFLKRLFSLCFSN